MFRTSLPPRLLPWGNPSNRSEGAVFVRTINPGPSISGSRTTGSTWGFTDLCWMFLLSGGICELLSRKIRLWTGKLENLMTLRLIYSRWEHCGRKCQLALEKLSMAPTHWSLFFLLLILVINASNANVFMANNRFICDSISYIHSSYTCGQSVSG